MLSEELKSIRTALGELMSKVDNESADLLRQCRGNLEDAAEQAQRMEEAFCPKEAAQ